MRCCTPGCVFQMAASKTWIYLTLFALFASEPQVGAQKACNVSSIAKESFGRYKKWTVTDNVLLEHDLQDVVDCTSKGDIIALAANHTVIPNTRLEIPHTLQIEGEGSHPSVLSCPQGEGLFLVRRKGLTLRNVRIYNCRIVQHDALIQLDLDDCASDADLHVFRLNRVEFRDIDAGKTNQSSIIRIRRPRCYRTIWKDVAFRDIRGRFLLAAWNNLLNIALANVTASSVVETDGGAVIVLPPRSKTIMRQLKASTVKGTVVHIANGELEINSAFFAANGHERSFGAVSVVASNLTVNDTTFESNRYPDGSCIYSTASVVRLRRSQFSKNDALGDGGCIYATQSQSVEVINSTFQSNTAGKRGGALYVEGDPDGVVHQSIYVSQSIFEANTAEYGGGISMEWSGLITVSSAAFRRNRAAVGEGAFSLRSAQGMDLYVVDSVFVENSVALKEASGNSTALAEPSVVGLDGHRGSALFDSCRFIRNDGYGLFLGERSFALRLSVANSVFDGGEKPTSSGVFAKNAKRSELEIFKCTFRDHNVTTNKMHVVYVEKLKAVYVVESTWMANKGSEKGALVISNVDDVKISSCQFSFNTAKIGGAVFVSSRAELSNCSFKENRAEERGGGLAISGHEHVDIRNSVFSKNGANIGGGMYATGGGFRVVGSQWDGNEAKLYGGAVALISDKKDRDVGNITGSTFLNNTAVLGGAVYVVGHRGRGDGLAFSNCLFKGGFAIRGGGAIFANFEEAVVLDCLRKRRRRRHSSNCTLMTDNAVGRGGYGPDVATPATRFVARFRFANGSEDSVAAPGTIPFDNWKSGDLFPAVDVFLIDAFDNYPAVLTSPTNNEESEASRYVSTPQGILQSLIDDETNSSFVSNPIYENESSGRIEISLGRPLVKPGFYKLTLRVRHLDQKIILAIVVRQCRINERTDLQGTACRSCSPNHYNFHPTNVTCAPCPKNANCSTDFIIPERGYWNALPSSPRIERCMHMDACPSNDVSKTARHLFGDLASLDDERNVQTYQQIQCEDGYEGPVCGSCKNGTGRTNNFQCLSCRHPVLTSTAVVGQLIILWLLTVLEINATRESSGSAYKQLRRAPRIKSRSRRVVRAIDRLVRISQGLSTTPATRLVLETRDDSKRMRVKYQELIKIGVNHAQTVAVGVGLDVSWSTHLVRFFASLDFLGGTFKVLGSYGLDCLLPYGRSIPRSVLREILVFSMPGLVLILMLLYWTIRTSRNPDERRKGRQLCILTIVILLNTSYISLVKSAFNAFYCIPVRMAEGTSRRWTVDTSIACGSDDHWLALSAVGISGIVFSIVFPCAVASVLVRFRRNHKLESESAQDTMGIFLGGYKEMYVYWDAVILLRKAILSAVLVFAYNLGGHLQGHLCITVLVMSLFLQTLINPFKPELSELNVLESISLLISILTFMTGLVLDDKKIPPGFAPTVLIVMILLCNVGMMFYLFIVVALLKIDLIKHALIVNNIDCGKGGRIDVIKAWMRNRLEAFGFDLHDEEPVGENEFEMGAPNTSMQLPRR